MLIDLDDLVTSTEIAQSLGVQQSAVSNWKNRYEAFPKPIKSIGKVDLYSRKDVLRWYFAQFPNAIEHVRSVIKTYEWMVEEGWIDTKAP